MEATTKDLRRHTAEILAAAERGEEVITTYRGRRRAVIRRWVEPVRDQSQADRNSAFGLWRERDGDVEETCHDPRRHGRLDLETSRQRAGDLLDGLGGGFCLSAVSYMELLQRMRDKRELRRPKRFLTYPWGVSRQDPRPLPSFP
jgi:antitoxin (DNA-binding transcriptional repressor) of toxin-antitoxin stability system